MGLEQAKQLQRCALGEKSENLKDDSKGRRVSKGEQDAGKKLKMDFTSCFHGPYWHRLGIGVLLLLCFRVFVDDTLPSETKMRSHS